MSFNCCSRNFSSHSCGGYLCYPGSSSGSPYPRNLVNSTDLCSPRTSQLACQETCWEPSSCQTSCVKSSPCQTFCCYLRIPMLCNSCSTCAVWVSGCCSLSYGSRSCSSLSYGSKGFRTLNYRIHILPPNLFSPFCRSGFY
uniref:Keratin-associated protein n=1 Tax=Cebus imitator TaxID=2715852 RepID=A0A2K5PK72_CEBIM